MFHVTETGVYTALTAIISGSITSMFSDKIKDFFKLITGRKRAADNKETSDQNRLQREREALDEKQKNLIDSMEKRITESFSEIQGLRVEINGLREQHHIKDQMVANFQTQVENLLKKIERLEEEKERLRNDKDEECTKRMLSLESELRREIASLSRELSDVRQDIQKPTTEN